MNTLQKPLMTLFRTTHNLLYSTVATDGILGTLWKPQPAHKSQSQLSVDSYAISTVNLTIAKGILSHDLIVFVYVTFQTIFYNAMLILCI